MAILITSGFAKVFYKFKETKKKSFNIVFTGGFSELFKNSVKTKAKYDIDITIKGLIKSLKLIK